MDFGLFLHCYLLSANDIAKLITGDNIYLMNPCMNEWIKEEPRYGEIFRREGGKISKLILNDIRSLDKIGVEWE